jgi:hypothetical protein
MGYLGYKPADKPLTSADITDGIIVNADIANSTINLTTKVTGTLPLTNGGTGLATLGTANQVLAVNSGASALEFQSVSSDFVKLATTNSTAGTASLDLSFSTTDYDTFFISANDVYCATTGAGIALKVSANSGSSYVNCLGTMQLGMQHNNNANILQPYTGSTGNNNTTQFFITDDIHNGGTRTVSLNGWLNNSKNSFAPHMTIFNNSMKTAANYFQQSWTSAQFDTTSKINYISFYNTASYNMYGNITIWGLKK